jgi:hypothetical protein
MALAFSTASFISPFLPHPFSSFLPPPSLPACLVFPPTKYPIFPQPRSVILFPRFPPLQLFPLVPQTVPRFCHVPQVMFPISQKLPDSYFRLTLSHPLVWLINPTPRIIFCFTVHVKDKGKKIEYHHYMIDCLRLPKYCW